MIKKIITRRENYIIIMTLILWAIISTINHNFAMPTYLLELIGFNSIYFICALGILPLMIKGNFDLSVGGMITSISLMLMAITSVMHVPFYALIIIGALLGIILGGFNGLIIGKFKIPSVIVTLAMMNVYYGFSKYIYSSIGSKLVLVDGYRIEAFQFMGLSMANLTIVLMILITYYLLRYHPLGRQIFAFGGDHKLALRNNFNDFKTTLIVHAFSGMSAGIVASLYLMTFNQASLSAYSGIEFELIIIVVIGGLNILGGYGTILGTVSASLFIVVLKSGLVFARIPVFWHDMFIGLIILLIVSYDMFKYKIIRNRFLGQGD